MVSMRDGKQTLQAAVDAYDEDVAARGEEVEMNRKQTQAFHNFYAESPFEGGYQATGKTTGKLLVILIVIMVYM